MTRRDYDRLTKRLMKQHRVRILARMNEWAEALRAAGLHVGDAFEMHDDEYRWCLVLYNDPLPLFGVEQEPRADITIGLVESQQYGEDRAGVNWRLDIVEWGGRILGGCCPHNYTPSVWTLDLEEIVERLTGILEIGPDELLDSLGQEAA